MRHITLYLFIWGMALSALSLSAQEVKRYDLDLKQASLGELVRTLEEVSDYLFLYGEEVRLAHPVSLVLQDRSMDDILRLAFRDQPVRYRISGNHILLYTKEVPAKRKVTISGYITDASSSETLIGANVLERIRQAGTYTNPFGFYTLTLPEGEEVSLAFSYLGYAPSYARFRLMRDTVLNVGLKTDNTLQEVLVLSDRKQAGVYATAMSSHEIPVTQIRKTPSLMGEADVLKTLQLLPGVQTAMEGFSGLYVRGGGADQNLILLDGIPIYNADHLLGLFSIFTPEAIKNVTLFKGSFPARFGGRLSSVVDIRTHDGDMREFHGTASIGLLTSKVHLEGPIWKDHTSFCFTGRRTYIDWIARPFLDEDKDYGYYFYDINAKLNHKFSDRSRVYLGFYKGKDHCDYKRGKAYEYDYASYFYNDRLDINWGNTVASGRWNYVFSNQLFSNMTLAYNHYQMLMNTGYRNIDRYHQGDNVYNYDSDYRSGIHDYSVQADFDYTPLPEHHVKFGTAYLYHRFRPEVMISRVKETTPEEIAQDTTYNAISNGDIYGHEWTLYAEDDYTHGAIGVNVGMNLSLFHTKGKSYFSAQPRVALRYKLDKGISLKASYTRMTQYVHLLSSSTIALPTDLWVPVTRHIRPMHASQYAFGAYYTGLKGWEFSLEGYYKDMRNVLEYQDGASFFASTTGWEDKVSMGRGRSMGLEAMAQKTWGKTTGWLAYTLAKSDRIFEDGSINGGRRFPYKYDRRHSLNVCVNHTFNKRWDIAASWVFNTGGTATVAEQRIMVQYPSSTQYSDGTLGEQDYISQRNNYRLPCSHRLNLGVNIHKQTQRGEHIWNISVYNVYNAMNPNLVFMDKEIIEHQELRPNGEYDFWTEVKTHLKKMTLLPCIPSFTYTFRF